MERAGIATAQSTVAAVIVSYNVRDLLRDDLRALLSAPRPPAEVVVVDNASEDQSAEMVAAEFPSVRLVGNTENRGFGAAANQGIALTRAPYVLVLNCDLVVTPTAVACMADYLDAHARVGAVSPRIFRPDGSLDLAARRRFPSPGVAFFRLSRLSRLFPRSRKLGAYNLTYRSPDEEQEIDSGTGACLLFRRAALDQVGSFDERFFMYGEDLDLCYRLKAAGWAVMYVPQAEVMHIKGASSRQRSARMIREFHRAMWLFYAKHYRARTPVLAPLVYAAIQARCAALLLANALRRDKRVSR